jgi:hypothetical protein
MEDKMAKIRVPKKIICVTLFLAVIAALLVYNPSTAAMENIPLYISRAHYQRFEAQRSVPDTGARDGGSLSSANCYSTTFHAATDCDRLASGNTGVGLSTNGVSTSSCFSTAYHAASDCDRLASGITAASQSSVGPTTSGCFSNAYHAATDCDRLASGIPSAVTLSSNPTLTDCFSAAYHAASDCDRLATEIIVASTKP